MDSKECFANIRVFTLFGVIDVWGWFGFPQVEGNLVGRTGFGMPAPHSAVSVLKLGGGHCWQMPGRGIACIRLQ